MRSPTRGGKTARPGDCDSSRRARERFEQLFRENSRLILGYALRRVERREDAADALAEVMLIAWRRLDDVPHGHDTRLWLFGVARRVVASQHRSAATRERLGERLRQEVSRLPARDESDDEEQEAVRAALRRLPEEDREILLLVAWEDLKPREAAKVIGISAPAARTRLHRARRRLRRELEANGMNDEPGPRNRAQNVPNPKLRPRIEEES